ncbi:hypothetical protein EDD21DRAFT_413240 [Dissophora ornata]|nr:hypothetical protein EDD21DRAFT_413240 [Dissophora ornata]
MVGGEVLEDGIQVFKQLCVRLHRLKLTNVGLDWQESLLVSCMSGEVPDDTSSYQWPDIESLSLDYSRATDEDLAAILALESAQHFNTVQVLNLDVEGVEGAAVCFEFKPRQQPPLLNSVSFPSSSSSSSIHDRSVANPTEADLELQLTLQQQRVFQRLSEFKQLEKLDVHNYRYRLQYSLDFRLSRGLGHLATLRRLKYLGFLVTNQRAGIEEAHWMLKNWKLLGTVRGITNTDVAIHEEVVTLLKSGGINTT